MADSPKNKGRKTGGGSGKTSSRKKTKALRARSSRAKARAEELAVVALAEGEETAVEAEEAGGKQDPSSPEEKTAPTQGPGEESPAGLVPPANETRDTPKVTVLLPAFNEEQALPFVIRDVRAAMQEWPEPYEILVVDDCSTDRTAEVAEVLDVRVVRRQINGGSGASRKTGIREAKGEVVVMLDADGTYEAADIPRLLEHFPTYDQVNGARTSEQGTLKWLRIPAKWFIRKLASFLSGVSIPDLNTGLKAFKRDVMRRYLWVVPDGFSCVTTMTLCFLCNGHPVKYVSTEYHPRIGRSKFHPFKDTLAYLMTVFRMITYFEPLKVFLPLAVLLGGLGLGKTLLDIFVPGMHVTVYVDLVLLLAALLVWTVGLLADLIVAQGRRWSDPDSGAGGG